MSALADKMKQYLCPPGNGVFTVHTAKEHKEILHEQLYATSNASEVQSKWEESLKKLDTSKVCLLGVTIDTGGGIQRGANWGPLFIRNKLLEGPRSYFDLGDTKTIPQLLHDKYLNEETKENCREALYHEKKSELPVSALSITQDFCTEFYKKYPSKGIFALGGDHSVSYSLVRPWLEAKKNQKVKTAIIHFDAHTDLMPHRLGIDICFASWAYHMIELLEAPHLLLQYGIRSSGQNKEYWQSEMGVQQFWNTDFKELGAEKIIDHTIKHLKEQNVQELYISFDIDALDAQYASATGTPESGGLAPHECIVIIKALAQEFKITGGDLVEVAPFVKSSLATKLAPEPETTLLSSKLIAECIIEAMNKCQ